MATINQAQEQAMKLELTMKTMAGRNWRKPFAETVGIHVGTISSWMQNGWPQWAVAMVALMQKVDASDLPDELAPMRPALTS